MKILQRLLINLVRASLWPAYLGLLSIMARIGPWPRSLGRPAGFIFAVLALTVLVTLLLRSVFRHEGWVHQVFELPDAVLKQLRHAKYALIASASVLLIPEELLTRGLITSGGRPIVTTTICHLLIISFEVSILVGLARLLRRAGPVGEWLATSPDQLGWVGQHRQAVRIFLLVVLASVIGLEIRGYGFTARRFAMAGAQSIVLLGLCWVLHRRAISLIAKNSWRWIRRQANSAAAGRSDTGEQAAELPGRVRHLVDWGVPILGCLLGLWIWDVDLALFNYVGEQPLWTIAPEVKNDAGAVITVATAVNVADVITSMIIFVVTAVAWRYLSTIFVLVVYPRMPEDPGIRFALLTLCRYLVLAIGILAGLSSLHLGLDKIGVVLAALGVGLGFGLQEIVSNFVSGIILLLERPIRVGDVITVASMTGKIDRINIRATTLINAENQCLIIPNREFITGNLINWTHKDKIIRFSIGVNVALGSDPDQVSELLLNIAKADSDVLGNPVPSAYLDAFGKSHLEFILHVFVPDPSYPGKVRHRLCTQIQKRFAEAGIEIPLPLQELRVESNLTETAVRGAKALGIRADQAVMTPPPPRFAGLANRTEATLSKS